MKLHIKVKGNAPYFGGSKITNVETGESVDMFGFTLEVHSGEMPTLNGQIVDVETDMTVDVGTLSSFSNEDLVAEIYRRQPGDVAREMARKVVNDNLPEAATCTCPSLAAGHMPDCQWKAARR